MSRPATTAEWNADRTAQLLDVTREGNKSSAVKLPRFNALRRKAKIVVDIKRFMWFSSPMNKTNTTMNNHPIYTKAARGEYIAPKDIAILVRTALKAEWPGVKFGVTSSRGGGSSVNVRWQDGPTSKQVETIAGQFETKGFDGMIDLAHSNSLWIYPDGSAHCAHDSGTEGSMGSAPEVIVSPKDGTAILLDNMASCYVMESRSLTAAAFHRAIAEYRAENWVGLEAVNWDAIEVRSHDDGDAYLANVPSIHVGGPHYWLDSAIGAKAYGYDMTQPQPETATTEAAHSPVLCW